MPPTANGALRVGVLGLGPMGEPIARNLVSGGFPVAVWNRTRAKAEAFHGVAATPLEPAQLRADVVLSVLPDVDQLNLVAPPRVLAAWAAAGTSVLAILSTTSPEKVRDFAGRAAAVGIDVVDAPMSGGDRGAREATLSIMVGGSEAAFATVSPVLDAIGGRVAHLGPLGAGTVAKLCNQLVVAGTLTALGEALGLARHAGLDEEALLGLFGSGLAASAVLDLKGEKMLRRDYPLGGSALNQLKDLRYAGQVAAELGARTPLLDVVTSLFAEVVDRGLGDSDHAVVREIFPD
ncbi:MAG TPA: NAD(P)-dependent oxidoreductase [Actinomycetales bacterium]|nr:NAD(P)-dependent oxidoreductase [Actinomycetales bacterium]